MKSYALVAFKIVFIQSQYQMCLVLDISIYTLKSSTSGHKTVLLGQSLAPSQTYGSVKAIKCKLSLFYIIFTQTIRKSGLITYVFASCCIMFITIFKQIVVVGIRLYLETMECNGPMIVFL